MERYKSNCLDHLDKDHTGKNTFFLIPAYSYAKKDAKTVTFNATREGRAVRVQPHDIDTVHQGNQDYLSGIYQRNHWVNLH